MKDKYSVFIKNQDIDQTDQIEKKFNENNFDLPEKINIIVESSKQGKALRTSKGLTNYLTREISSNANGKQIHSFSELQKRINNSLLRDFKETNSFGDVTVEGQFVNPIGHYQHESVDIRIRIEEKPIFSQFLTLNADKRSNSVGVLYRPLFTNMFGQCEFLSFSLSKNLPLFDYYKTQRASVSLLLPYVSHDSGVSEYKLTHTTRSVLKDLDQINYRAQLNFVPKTKNLDNRWKLSLYSIAHHCKHSVNSDNQIAQSDNILDQTQNVYQNVILKARYMKDLLEDSQQSSNVIKIKGRIGYGSNGSVFTKLDLKSHFEKLAPFEFADKAFTGVIENKFVAKGLISASDLVNFKVIASAREDISNHVAFHEKYLLANEPSFKNIDLRDKSINSSTIGSQFYATNQTKFYLPEFPFLKKMNIIPFFNFYTAFVPTDLKIQSPNKLNEIIQKNLRASAGIGLTYRMNQESFKVDFIYSFGQLFAKPENDEFARFQLSFYQ